MGRWDGSVAAAASFAPSVVGYVSVFDDVVAPAWTELTLLIQRLGGYGPMRLVLRIVGAGPIEYPGLSGSSILLRLTETIELRRNVEATPPTGEQLGSIQREMQRATGIFSWEPEPPSAC